MPGDQAAISFEDPMNRSRPTLNSVASEILSMYRALVGDEALSDAIVRSNLLGRRLQFLKEAAAGSVTLDQMTQEQAILFQETLLDSTALQSATGGRSAVFDSLETQDPTLLGGSRFRRAKLRESDDSQLDWHFQILVQAWASSKALGPVKDLQDDPRFKNQRACDFRLRRGNGRSELLECKRVHPITDQIGDPVQGVIAKIIDRLPDGIDQLRRTAAVIGTDVCDQHLLVDISAYAGSSLRTMCGAVQVDVGGFQEEQLSEITARIAPQCTGLARLTLCWHAPIKLDGMYRAIIQRSKVVFGQGRAPGLLHCEGWTVEGYPMSNTEYREFRVSSVARSLDWIVASYNSMSSPETFIKFGPKQRVG